MDVEDANTASHTAITAAVQPIPFRKRQAGLAGLHFKVSGKWLNQSLGAAHTQSLDLTRKRRDVTFTYGISGHIDNGNRKLILFYRIKHSKA